MTKRLIFNKKTAEREFVDGASPKEVHLPRTDPAADNSVSHPAEEINERDVNNTITAEDV